MNYLEKMLERITTSFPMRFGRKQKAKFREFVLAELAEAGWEAEVQSEGWILRSHNIVTRTEQANAAEVMLLAHYDTATCLPPLLGPLTKLVGNNGAMMFMFGAIGGLAGSSMSTLGPRLADLLSLPHSVGGLLGAAFCLLFFGPMLIPNRNNHNDNTSGVLTLLGVAKQLAERPELRGKVQLAFVDQEENGLLGSARLRKRLLAQGVKLAEKQIIVFDCVGKGDIPLVCYPGKDNPVAGGLHAQLSMSRPETKLANLSLSDHLSFKKDGVAAAVIFGNKAKLGEGHYIVDVHSPRDNQIRLENVQWLVDEMVYLAEQRADAESTG